MLAAVLLAAAAASPQPASNPDLLRVQRIEIRSTAGAGLGTNRFYNAVIARKNGQLQLDGMFPSSRIVGMLLDALRAQPIPKAQASSFQFKEQGQEVARESLRDCLGDAADLPPVQQSFDSLFRSAANQNDFLAAYYGGTIWHTDDYPTEKVEVTFQDGSKITAQSDSQTQYMLPFTITADGSSYKTFDPTLSRAITELSVADVNYERLLGRQFFSEYGKSLCGAYRDPLDAIVVATFTPLLSDYVKRQRIQVGRQGLSLTPDLGAVKGEIRFPEWPAGFTFGIFSEGAPLNATATQAAGLRALEAARHDGDRISRLPWLKHWMNRSVGGSLFLNHLVVSPIYVDESKIMDELRRHSPKLYRVVSAEEGATLYGMLWDAKSKLASDWLFLPDGRSALVQFHATDSTLGPLTKVEVASWSSFVREENDASYPWRSTVTVINAMGAIIQP